MPPLDDLAIALRRSDYSETSQVLVLFGRAAGKIRLIAKGVKRGTKQRFAPAIDLLEMGHLVFSERQDKQANLAILVEWRQITIFPGLRCDLRRLYGAQYLAETTANLTENRDPHEALFDALSSTLTSMQQAAQALPLVVAYQARLLAEIGLFPEVGRCLECARSAGAARDWYFSSHQGGLICPNCESVQVEKRRVRPGAIELLRALADDRTPPAADRSPWVGAFYLLDYHISHLAGKQAATAQYVVPQTTRRTLT
jgi:DNA repair protein RecO (recombination protein O)